MNIQELPANLLLEKLRKRSYGDNDDSDEELEKEQTTRWSYLNEITRRTALVFLEQLGWPSEKTGIYKNRYTAHEETLLQMYENRYQSQIEYSFDEWMQYQTPFMVESWLPKEHWTPSECFKEYLPKNTLMGWF